MGLSKSALLTFAAVGCLVSGSLFAQTDYSTKTLSFDDITSTNINQTVNESNGNEKEIDFADYDNDGDLDVVMAVALSDFGQRRNKLYRNDSGVLNEVSGTSVIPEFSNQDTSRSAFFRDFDNDGFADIVILNDSNSGDGSNNSPGKTKYYRNVGGNSFVNESGRLDSLRGAACNGTVADFDGNGFLDVMMVNYPNTSQDALALNNINGAGAGQFDVVNTTHMPSDNRYGVHGESADMNGDGKIDLLVANRTNEPAFIHYNDNGTGSSGLGDFRYTGSSQTISDSSGGVAENAMIPADFNNDGLMDFYYANAGVPGRTHADAIYLNTGNNGSNHAQFQIVPMIDALDSETFKATIDDLDNDGRMDVIVMSEVRRPYILRNTSENGELTFIDWTPSMFAGVSGSSIGAQEGWQAKSTDITGNGRPDILLGAYNDDFLYENVSATITEFDSLVSGILPSFVDSAPIAISGSIAAGETLTLLGVSLPLGAEVTVLARSSGADLSLAASINGDDLGSSSRPGEDVDEALTFEITLTGAVLIEITNESKGGVLLGDVNQDGMVNLSDVQPFVDLLGNGGFLAEADMNQDGSVNLSDVQPFVEALASGGGGTGGGGSSDFIVELVGRTN